MAIVALCLLTALPGCSEPTPTGLRVGMELAYPPFEMTDATGQPAGVSVEIARALAKHLGLELDIQNLPFDGLIPALRTGKIDLILSSMTETSERAEAIDFSAPYLRTGLCLLISKESPIQSAADLDVAGRVIAVKLGTTGHTHALENFKSAKVIVLEKEDACVLEVVQRKADAFIYDQMSVYKNWDRNPDTTRPLLNPFREASWGIGIRKGNETLRERVNGFLDDFRGSGGFERLGDQFLKEQKDAFQKLGYPFYF